MNKFLLLISSLFFAFGTYAQCISNVNFSNWVQGGHPSNGNWSVQNGGAQVYQSVNGNPTFFLSPYNLMNVHISGEFRTTDDDDDWMGFVFSYQNPMGAIDSFDCWLFDWKRAAQDGAQNGMALCRIDGVVPPADYTTTFWNHQNNAAFTTVQNNFGSGGWTEDNYHSFDLYLTYTTATIYVDGVLKFTQNDCFKPGRFGFYNYSQEDCTYRNFQYDLFVDFDFVADKICTGANGVPGDSARIQFVNPCVTDATAISNYQTATWNFGDGSPPVVINNPTIFNINQAHYYANPGTYNVSLTIVDNNNCSATKTNPIEVRQPISITPSGTQPPCNGGTNGSVTVTATGGYGNYTYSWNGGVNTLQTYNGVGAGTYNILVSDGVCTAATANYTLGQPTALTASTSHVDASCATNNGSVTINISGGTPPYQNISWAGTPAPSGTLSNVGPGNYIANFQDANNCSALLQYSETVASLPCGITSSISKTNVSCFGGSNGSATLTVGGATGPGNVVWTPGNYNGYTVNNLPAGTYTYTFTDNNPAHTFSGTVTITQPSVGMSASVSTIGISCAGSNDGQALASVTAGGVSPYSYNWGNGLPNSPNIINRPPGAVNVTITDASGCTATASGTISSSPTLVSTFTTVIDSCYHAGRGSASINVTGGTPPYIYQWSNLATDTLNNNIKAGTYTITVTDDKGCTITGSAVVGGPSTPLNAAYSKQDVLCNGTTTGSILLNTTGGTSPYTYAWNPNTLSGNNPTNLAAGIYKYTVTDAYGCYITGDDTLREPATPLSVTSTHTNVSCPGTATGSITVTVGGGTPPYTYQGNTVPPGTYTQNNVPAGIYTGTVTDANGCAVTISDTITEPAAQSLTLTATNASCNGYADGAATANFVNATGTVTYNWNPGGIQPGARTGLTAGTYTVTATDANTCTVSGSVAINEPPAIQVQEAHTNVSCFGFTDGDITLTVTSNTGPYTYNWNPNVSSSNTATNIASGLYNITVTDQTTCSVSVAVVVTQPFAPVSDSIIVQDVTCFGLTDGRITLITTGGTSTFTYTWNPNVSSSNNANNLAAGTYNVTVADVNNCSLTESIVITEPAAPLALTQSQTDLTCNGDSSGSATVNVTGGTSPYIYTWNPNVGNTATVNNLAAGNYTVLVTDDHLCTISASYTLTEPAALTASHVVTNLQCFGDANGRVVVTATGGTGTYIYNWNPAVSTTDTAQNLPAGSYAYTVTDASGCIYTNSASVTQPTQLVVSRTYTDATCNGSNDGTITATAVGGTTPYSYSVTTDGSNFQNSTNGLFTSLVPGNYIIILSDLNGCTDTSSATILDPPAVTIQLVATDVVCYGYNNGQIIATTGNGTQPFTYTLSNGDQNNNGIFTSLAANSYSLTATDANGCTATDTTSITEPVEVLVDITPDSADINLGEALTLQSSTNQSGAVTYTWSPAAGLSCTDCAAPDFNAYSSLGYTLTVTNSDGCIGIAQAYVAVKPSYDVFIPNAFSPNGDGANDEWQIYGNMAGIKQMSVEVYNRTGEKVFEGTDINFKWDGKYKGVQSPPGVYVYVAKFVWLNNFTDTVRKGAITILK